MDRLPSRLAAAAAPLHLGLVAAVALAACSSAPSPTAPPPAAGPHYVIVLQGDGMGPEHVRAGGLYVNGAAGTLPFEAFPHRTTMTHDNAAGNVTDSAASATAMATGVKVSDRVVSMRLPGNGAALPTVLELHRDHCRSTGLVTVAYLTDASPAAYGAHEPSRGNQAAIFQDYVTQSRPDVLLGGGGHGFDGAAAAGQGYTLVADRAALLSLDTEKETRVAGGFGSGLIPPPGYAGRDAALPSLPEMAATALKILDNDPDGFFLFVEQEGVDEYSHKNDSEGMVRSMAELADAAQTVLDWIEDPATPADWSNTLVVVLADHETGGLRIEADNGRGKVPALQWTDPRKYHTKTPVPVAAKGAGADRLTGAPIDNTEIFALLQPRGPAAPCGAAGR